ncbi:MAG TPA: lysylphosphatidylglycerol synthase transmembrane domain-containing protein [Chitinispirillaceae bacterium]|nr:lysylphosphatidylglycerol synthase transmembrane domain-containing protein [Chitinispirillaceae bacterium]
MKKSTILQLGAGALVTAGGLYIFLKEVKLSQLWLEVCQTPISIIIATALLSPLSLFFRSIRLKLFLKSSNKATVTELFPQVVIGFMANNIFPARLGEAVRIFLLWKKSGFTLAESIGALVVERIIDTVFFLPFFFIPVFFSINLKSLHFYGYILVGVFATACFCGFLYGRFPSFVKKIGKSLNGFLPKKMRTGVGKIGSEVISNLDWLFSIKKTALVFVLSFTILFCYAIMMWLLGIDLDNFGALGGMFGVAFAAIGAAIPLAPGYVGTMHALLLSGLGMAGVAAERAGAIAVLYHAIGYVTVTSLGLYYFFSIKLSFRMFETIKKDLSGE